MVRLEEGGPFSFNMFNLLVLELLKTTILVVDSRTTRMRKNLWRRI